MEWAWAQATPSVRAKLALVVLAHKADDQGDCHLSLAQLVAITGICRRAVRGKLRALEARGLIRCQLRRGMQTDSRFQLDPRSVVSLEGGKGVAHA
jgi:predicted ArsR family transcriptional regulator